MCVKLLDVIILLMSVGFVVIPPSFLILAIYVFSAFKFFSLASDLSILLMLSENHLSVSFSVLLFLFHFICSLYFVRWQLKLLI